jgi:hypothetical protein
MNKLAIFLLLALVGQVGQAEIFEQMGPGTFEQMQTGTVSSVSAKIFKVRQAPGGYLVIYQLDDVTKTSSLCIDDRMINENYTEADRSMAIQDRVRVLRKASVAKSTIMLAVRGPWSPCVWPADSI